MRIAHRIAVVLLALAGSVALGSDPSAPHTPGSRDKGSDPLVRQSFLSALAAVDAQPTGPATGDPEALRDYVLYPYLQAARLRRQLELAPRATAGEAPAPTALDADIAAFLAGQGAAPVTTRLRNAWLADLAARKAWPTYLEHFDPARDVAVTLQCHALGARAALGRTDGLLQDLERAWLTPKSLPDACDAAIAWWQARGGPGADLTERRARLALEAGDAALARYLARSLPAERAAPLTQWAELIEQPSRAIVGLINVPERAVEPAALNDGWMRFARADAELAAATLPSLVAARKLDARAASPLALSVALALAWSRLPGALEHFARVHADDFDERAHEWHVRAALWASDWPRVAAAVAAMPEPLRTQARWRYWEARAAEKNGDFARARELYAAVIPTDNWYAALSAARLDRKVTPHLQPLALADAELDRLAAEPAFRRTRELLLAGMESEANAEWKAGLDALAPSAQPLAVGLAARWGWHHQAIATAARLRIFNDYDLLYPRPYDAAVGDASRRTGLPESLIYAVIRQESLYRADAGSSAGALGLMQLLPATAKITAKRAGVTPPANAQLLLPEVNVPLGSRYLAGLVERFDGETALATAGYNAGPGAAKRWQPPAPLPLDVWAENIPYNETRSYVQRVAWHALVFDWLQERKPRDASALLRSIQPAPTTTASAD